MSTKKPEEPRRSWESVRYDFTRDELRALGMDLAVETQMVYDLQQKKKELAAQMKVAILEAEGRCGKLALKLNQRYEMREAECTVMMHTPRAGMKSTVRVDNGEVVREEKMTAEEMQEKLPFEALKEDDESQPRKGGKRDPNVN
jgi:hypothetical protein